MERGSDFRRGGGGEREGERDPERDLEREVERERDAEGEREACDAGEWCLTDEGPGED